MTPKELAVVNAATSLVDWFRRFPNQPRTNQELRLWRAIDAAQGTASVNAYRENRLEIEREAAKQTKA